MRIVGVHAFRSRPESLKNVYNNRREVVSWSRAQFNSVEIGC